MRPIATEQWRRSGYIDSVEVRSWRLWTETGIPLWNTTMHSSMILLGILFGLLAQAYTLPLKVSTKGNYLWANAPFLFTLAMLQWKMYYNAPLYDRILLQYMREKPGWKGDTQVGYFFFIQTLHHACRKYFNNDGVRPLNLSLFGCSDEITDRDEMNAMDHILGVNRSK